MNQRKKVTNIDNDSSQLANYESETLNKESDLDSYLDKLQQANL